MKVYSGYYKDNNKLLNSSSGGVATALSEAIVSKGGVVFGVRYTPDFYGAEYCCIDKIQDLNLLKGSKYVHAKVGMVLNVLEEQLISGRLVLFIGLGCDIAAVNRYCNRKKLDTSKLYTVDILCHGPMPNEIHTKYIQELEEQNESRIKKYTIRYKKDGWTPFYIKAIFENDKQFVQAFNESDYGKAFRHVAIPACTDCKFKGSNHTGDICIGDFWGMTSKMNGWNPNGVSIIMVQKERGTQLLNLLDDSFYIQEENEEFVLKGNPMYSQSRVQKCNYSEFINDFRSAGLHYAVSKFPIKKTPLREKLKNKLVNLRNRIFVRGK